MLYGKRRLSSCVLDLDTGRIEHSDGRLETLTGVELKLLRYLDAHEGKIISTDELHTEVWGYSSRTQTRAASKAASRLRKKIEPDPGNPIHLIRYQREGFSFHSERLRSPPASAPETAAAKADPGFVGRASELSAIREGLQEVAVVTLWGIGGVGKSRTAEAHLHAHGAEYPGGSFVVPLAAARTSMDVLVLVGQALGLSARVTELAEQLPHALASRGRCLLLLDNVEQITEATAALVRRWQDTAPQARFLVTSRQPLGLHGERVISLEGLLPADASTLFKARMRNAIAAADEPTIAALVEQLDHLPLAIEMAATRTDILSPAQLLSQLQSRFRLLSHRRHDLPERHRSLYNTLLWSWQLLSEEEQHALMAASLLEAPFTAEAAEAIFPQQEQWTLDLLQSLRECCMLQRCVAADGKISLSLLISIRDFGRQKLTEHEAEADPEHTLRAGVLSRLAAHYAPVQTEKDETLGALKRWQDELGNFLVGARQRYSIDDAVQCGMNAMDIYFWSGAFRSGLTLGKELLACDGMDAALRAQLQLQLARLHRMLSQHEDARRCVEAALAFAETGDHASIKIQARLYRGNIAYSSGDFTQALEELTAALALEEAHGEGTSEYTIRGNIAAILLAQGRLDDAQAHLMVSLSLVRQHDQPMGEGVVLSRLGSLCYSRQQYQQAISYTLQALEIHRERGNRIWEAISLGNLGTNYERCDQPERALLYFRDARALHEQLGNRFGSCITAVYTGELLRRQGEQEEAHVSLLGALTLAKHLDSNELLCRAHLALTRLGLATGQLALAQEHIDAGLHAARQLSANTFLTELIACEGLLALHRDDRAHATAARSRAGDLLSQAAPRESLQALIAALDVETG